MSEFVELISRHAIVVIEAMALVIIIFGTLQAFISAFKGFFTQLEGHERRDIWLRYAHWLVAGLTFQLAADIIESSITTDWQSVVRLGIVALIRTMLNYFLSRDLDEIRERQNIRDPLSGSSPP